MPSELAVHATHNQGMCLTMGAGKHSVTVDYPLQPGQETEGMRPLELLLSSLAGCVGGIMAMLLRRMEEPVSGLEVDVRGARRDEHPTVITEIDVEVLVRGSGVDPTAVSKALEQCEERVAPVWAMLKAGTPMRASFRIVEA
ncbi:MAG TPA: OsmC family protein [Thermoleophilia bacterium]